jgi:hypothetical protein
MTTDLTASIPPHRTTRPDHRTSSCISRRDAAGKGVRLFVGKMVILFVSGSASTKRQKFKNALGNQQHHQMALPACICSLHSSALSPCTSMPCGRDPPDAILHLPHHACVLTVNPVFAPSLLEDPLSLTPYSVRQSSDGSLHRTQSEQSPRQQPLRTNRPGSATVGFIRLKTSHANDTMHTRNVSDTDSWMQRCWDSAHGPCMYIRWTGRGCRGCLD